MHPHEDVPLVTTLPPSPALAPFVYEHWVSSWDLNPRSRGYRRLHHPCVAICFHAGKLAVSGVRRARQLHRPHGGGPLIGTRFRPGAFSVFSDLPAQELLERHVSAEDAFGADGLRLERDLVAAPDDVEARIELIEDFLTARLRRSTVRYELVENAISTMTDFEADWSVAALAADQGVSVRTLQRAFQDLVGVGPKWIRRRYRVHAATSLIASGGVGDAGALALELGYFDQSHFTNDFKAAVGVSPQAFAQLCREAPASPSRSPTARPPR